ncbi:DUF2604 domain-containing protein [Mycoplasmatota bacterium zrk1]
MMLKLEKDIEDDDFMKESIQVQVVSEMVDVEVNLNSSVNAIIQQILKETTNRGEKSDNWTLKFKSTNDIVDKNKKLSQYNLSELGVKFVLSKGPGTGGN